MSFGWRDTADSPAPVFGAEGTSGSGLSAALSRGFRRGMDKAVAAREQVETAVAAQREICGWLADQLAQSFGSSAEFADFSVLEKNRTVYVLHKSVPIIQAFALRTKLDKPNPFMPCGLSVDDYQLYQNCVPRDPRNEGDWSTVLNTIGFYCALKKAGVAFRPGHLKIEDE